MHLNRFCTKHFEDMNSITKTSLSTIPKGVHRKFLCVWVMTGKCKRKANVFKRCRSSEGVNSAGANKAALEDVQLKSQARLSWVSFLLTALRNHSSPDRSESSKQKSAESSWYCVKLIAEKQRVRVLIDIPPEILLAVPWSPALFSGCVDAV